MWGFSHSSVTLADAECSSMSESHVPVSIRVAPSLAAVKGPTSVSFSELYMKRTELAFIFEISSANLSLQAYFRLLKHSPNDKLLQKSR